jgi:hypothetical protein
LFSADIQTQEDEGWARAVQRHDLPRESRTAFPRRRYSRSSRVATENAIDRSLVAKKLVENEANK